MENQHNESIFDEVNLVSPQFEYAGTGQRFVNFIIDVVAYYALIIVLSAVFGVVLALTGNADMLGSILANKLLVYLVVYSIYVLYYTLLEGLTKGRSLGKLATKTVAVNEDLSPITMKTALVRSLCRLIPFEWIRIFNGGPMHDSIPKTYVIKKNRLTY